MNLRIQGDAPLQDAYKRFILPGILIFGTFTIAIFYTHGDFVLSFVFSLLPIIITLLVIPMNDSSVKDVIKGLHKADESLQIVENKAGWSSRTLQVVNKLGQWKIEWVFGRGGYIQIFGPEEITGSGGIPFNLSSFKEAEAEGERMAQIFLGKIRS